MSHHQAFAEDAAQLRDALKEHGWTGRDVSVRILPAGLRVEIKSTEVKEKVVRRAIDELPVVNERFHLTWDRAVLDEIARHLMIQEGRREWPGMSVTAPGEKEKEIAKVGEHPAEMDRVNRSWHWNLKRPEHMSWNDLADLEFNVRDRSGIGFRAVTVESLARLIVRMMLWLGTDFGALPEEVALGLGLHRAEWMKPLPTEAGEGDLAELPESAPVARFRDGECRVWVPTGQRDRNGRMVCIGDTLKFDADEWGTPPPAWFKVHFNAGELEPTGGSWVDVLPFSWSSWPEFCWVVQSPGLPLAVTGGARVFAAAAGEEPEAEKGPKGSWSDRPKVMAKKVRGPEEAEDAA